MPSFPQELFYNRTDVFVTFAPRVSCVIFVREPHLTPNQRSPIAHAGCRSDFSFAKSTAVTDIVLYDHSQMRSVTSESLGTFSIGCRGIRMKPSLLSSVPGFKQTGNLDSNYPGFSPNSAT